jgi:hypothetical protein
LQDFRYDGEQYMLRFHQKGGKSREIPVRLELQRIILPYVDAAGLGTKPKDRALFRSRVCRTKQLTARPLTLKAVYVMVKLHGNW